MEIARPREAVRYEDAIREVGPGWHPLVREVFEVLASDARSRTVVQVKEKFGGLRVYISPYFFDPVEHAILEICARSYEICEECGKPGQLCKKPSRWFKTLCEDHRAEVQATVINDEASNDI